MGEIPRGRGSAVKSKVRISLGRGRLGVGLEERGRPAAGRVVRSWLSRRKWEEGGGALLNHE